MFLLHLYETFALLSYRYVLLPLKIVRILSFAYNSMMHYTYLFTFVFVYDPLHTCKDHGLCMGARDYASWFFLSTIWVLGIKGKLSGMAEGALTC